MKCQFIGKDQDPRRGPVTYCGAQTLEAKSYCGEHYYVVYQRGSAPSGRKKEKAIDQEIEQLKLQQELDEMEAYE